MRGHSLGECPNGTDWCDSSDHLCAECTADLTDRIYDEWRDNQMLQNDPTDVQNAPEEDGGGADE